LVLALFLGAGGLAYFLLRPKSSSGSRGGGYAGSGRSVSGGDGSDGVVSGLAGYPAIIDNTPSTTDNTPETGQPSTHSTTSGTVQPSTYSTTSTPSAFPYHIVGYEVRIMEGSADMATLPFNRPDQRFPHQNGVIPVSNGLYNVGWGLDMAVAGDGIQWRLDVQGTVKSGKFLFKDMTYGKKAEDWGYASVGWWLLAGRVTWKLTMWVE
jgi:hypothetical protein